MITVRTTDAISAGVNRDGIHTPGDAMGIGGIPAVPVIESVEGTSRQQVN